MACGIAAGKIRPARFAVRTRRAILEAARIARTDKPKAA
jgi:hypothetical protein